MANGNILALLPMWNNQYSIVWSINLDEYDSIMKLDDTAFVKELNNSFQKPFISSNLGLPFTTLKSFEYPPIISGILNKRMTFPYNTL